MSRSISACAVDARCSGNEQRKIIRQRQLEASFWLFFFFFAVLLRVSPGRELRRIIFYFTMHECKYILARDSHFYDCFVMAQSLGDVLWRGHETFLRKYLHAGNCAFLFAARSLPLC